ncbi:hypothetical protein BKA66DRAFT_573024 [Pyrenochaeta sp. MPI-SDFR-AT-0127]|nr:hypothetical protein BKA66DRAFT_573024 [Pyrenochaeta sp. MPI-SDFR-AT-0127]
MGDSTQINTKLAIAAPISTGALPFINKQRSEIVGAPEETGQLFAHGPVGDSLVEALPWDYFPSEESLPLVDDLQGSHKTTTFIDLATKTRAHSILSSFCELVNSYTPRPVWAPSQSLTTRSLVCLILHFIKRHDLLSSFIDNGVEDTDIPLDFPKLQSFLKDDLTIKAFYKAQYKAVLRDLEDGVAIYEENELLPFRTIRPLGSGGYARVDCVEHVLQGQQFAHKVFHLTSGPEQRMQKTFRLEMQSLKKLSNHQHIVKYLGAYRSPKCLGLLLHPVAECDLHQFLKHSQAYDFMDRRKLLLRCFGCLTSALAYMHAQQIRHKDVKPQNVLLEYTASGTNLLFTDFGIAMDFSAIAKSTTDGPEPQRTERYCAPEVARNLARGRRSDVYSLGCLLVEVATVMVGYDLKDLDDWLGGDCVFHDSEVETTSWISKLISELQEENDETMVIALKWIAPMIRKRPSQRPQMQTVVDNILEEIKAHRGLRRQLFCNFCIGNLQEQSKISSTNTSTNSFNDLQESDDEFESEEDQANTDAAQQNNAQLHCSMYESAADMTSGLVLNHAHSGSESIYVDIAAIPRLQSSSVLLIVHTYVSLVECLRSYNYFANIQSFWSRKDYGYLRRRLDFEMLRLLNWSFVIGLSRGGLLLPSELQSMTRQKNILNNVLQQQAAFERCLNRNKIPADFLHRRDGQGFEIGSDRHVPAIARSLLNSMFSSIIIKPSQTESPASFSFAFDPPVLVETLEELEGKNDQLRAMLDPSTLEMLLEKDAETNLELLQLSETLEDIIDLICAVRPGRHSTDGSSHAEAIRLLLDVSEHSTNCLQHGLSTREAIAQFARFKALNTMMETYQGDLWKAVNQAAAGSTVWERWGRDADSNIELSQNDITFFNDEVETGENLTPVSGLYRIRGSRKKRLIWVEWKDYAEDLCFGPTRVTHDRIRKLALLLNDPEKPREFYIPHCLGYFNDEEEGRFGLVFGVPSYVQPSDSFEPVSLFDIIRSKPDVPVLARLELALKLSNSVLYLHSVNWLHKGLGSRSVIFFLDKTGTAKLEEPIVSGFDYSRPALNDDMTEIPLENPWEDIYRHPSVQSTRNRGRFQKIYDIYSLGVILTEIAYWRPIAEIMNINLDKARAKDIWVVHKRLLTEEYVRDGIINALGPEYWDVVHACIEGLRAFGLENDSDERNTVNAATLQAGFYRKVIRRLKYLVKGRATPLRS